MNIFSVKKQLTSFQDAFSIPSDQFLATCLKKLSDHYNKPVGFIGCVITDFVSILNCQNLPSPLNTSTEIPIIQSLIPIINNHKRSISITLPKEHPFSKHKMSYGIGIPIYELNPTNTLLGVVELYSKTPLNDPFKTDDLILPYIRRLSLELSLIKSNQSLALIKRKIEVLTEKDPTTGTYKQAFLYTRLEKEFRRAKRYNRPLSCMLVELKNLPELNRKYGKPTCESILKKISQLLGQSLRTIDTVFRYSTSEFFVILPETKIADSFVLAERLRFELESATYVIEQGANYPSEKIDIIFGLSSYPNDNISSPQELIQLTSQFKSQQETIHQ